LEFKLKFEKIPGKTIHAKAKQIAKERLKIMKKLFKEEEN